MTHEYAHGYFFRYTNFSMNKQHEIINNWHADQASVWGSRIKSLYWEYYSSAICGNTDTYSKYGLKIINYIP